MNIKNTAGNSLPGRTSRLTDRKYLEFFVPTVLTAMANSIAMLVDSTIVNLTLGKEAFAAVNLLNPVVQLYVAVSILFGMSGAAVIAKLKGEGGAAEKGCDAAFTSCILMLLASSALLMIIQFSAINSLVSALTGDPVLQPLVKGYYLPLAAGTPVTLLMLGGVYIIRTEGRPRFASLIVAVSNIINLLCDIIFILVFKMGIAGAAAATVTGNFAGLLMFLSHFRRPDNTLHFSLKALGEKGIFAGNLKAMLAGGFSGSLGAVLIVIKMLFLNSLVQLYGGSVALVAFSVVSLCQILDSAFVAGACQTMVPLYGMFLGEGDYDGIKYAFLRGLKILVVSTLSITVVMELFAGPIVRIYGMTEAASMYVGIRAVRLCALLFPADALTFLGLYHFLSVGRSRASSSISFINGIVFVIPLGLILPPLLGIDGVWLTLSVSQYLVLLYVLILALVIKRRGGLGFSPENGECADGGELFAFSLNGKEWNCELETALCSAAENVLTDIEAYPEVKKMLDSAGECLSRLDVVYRKGQGKGRMDTDVRVCRGAVIIKNTGVQAAGEDFADIEGAEFSRVLGFNRLYMSSLIHS